MYDQYGNWLPDPQPITPNPPPTPSGGDNSVTGSGADPNVAGVTPPDPNSASFYYQDSAKISFWAWSVSGQKWIAFIAQ